MEWNTVNPKKRKTVILDDDAALALPQPKQKKAKRSNNAAASSVQPISSMSATATNADSAPQKAASTGIYEAEGLRIPLLHKNGKRKAGARQATSLARKPQAWLLDVVEEYAGHAKRLSMQSLPKQDVAEWIEEAETRAMGVSNRKLRAIATSANANAVAGHPVTATVNAGVKSPVVTKVVSPIHNVVAPSGKNNEGLPANSGREVLTPTSTRGRAKVGKPANEIVNVQAAATNQFVKPNGVIYERLKKKRKGDSTMAEPTLAQDTDEDLDAMMQQAYAYFDAQPDAGKDLPVKVPTHDLTEHPLIGELGLEPDHPFNHTRIIDLGAGEKVIITATSRTAVHETHISTSSFVSDSRPETPYLKPGKHGYDWEEHRFNFANAPDLETGAGHQIEPEDEEKLQRDPNFEQIFKGKYQGYGAHQWPCGCLRPWNDDDSEDES